MKNPISYLFSSLLLISHAYNASAAIVFNTRDQSKVDRVIDRVKALEPRRRHEEGSALLIQAARELEVNGYLSEAVAIGVEAHSKYVASPSFIENQAWLVYYLALDFCRQGNEKLAEKYMQFSRQSCLSSGGETCKVLEMSARHRLAQINSPAAMAPVELPPFKVVTRYTLYGNGKLTESTSIETQSNKNDTRSSAQEKSSRTPTRHAI